MAGISQSILKTQPILPLLEEECQPMSLPLGFFATWFGSETVMGASSEFIENGLFGVNEDPFGASFICFY